MASVFLSYDRDDTNAARVIATALEKAGHSVWWDLHVRGGAQFSKVIEEALKAADVVVVLWSANSIESAWVRDEAAAGRDSGRLVPASIDGTQAPLGFRQFQTIGLTDWKRGAKGRGYKELSQAIADCAGEAHPGGTPTGSPTAETTSSARSRRRWLAVAAIAVALLAGGLAAWRYSDRASSVPVVAVTAADESAGALARDILVKLGSLRSAKTDAIRLTAPAAGKAPDADFVFEAAAGNDQKDISASLALLAGKNRTLLWSKDFETEAGNRAALEQSMAYTAGQVLDCALQATAASDVRIDEETMKLFLNGCALFAERDRSDLASLIPIFSQVVAKAPRFQPAWAKLLLAEGQYSRGEMMFKGRWALGQLPQHIRLVEKLNPRMPELYVAKTALIPPDELIQRSALLDEAARLGPDNPNVLATRAELLSFIGRNDDAVNDARRTVEIDPLSPGFRGGLIQILAYGGLLAEAAEELHRAEKLWPSSRSIDDARFRFNSRYGDAKDALHMLRTAEFRQLYMTPDMGPYLQARLDPTEANVQRAIAAVRSPQLPEIRRPVQLVQLLAEFGRDEEAYKLLMSLPPDKLHLTSGVFWRPPLRKLRQDPRFIQIAVRAGLVDFWRKSGKWPDFCFEPDLPYDCKKEAARLGA